MKTVKVGDRGAAVKRLQEFGDLLGYDYGPNDGIFGVCTDALVHDLQRKFTLCQDGIVGPMTWSAILSAIDAESGQLYPIGINGIHDISGVHPPPKNFGHLRPWRNITGVTLHQTGCAMPRHATGWERVNAHYGITSDGVAILINRPEDMIWHAQRLSPSTIGIEIAGNYEGLEGHRSTLWLPGGGPACLTDAMVDAASAIYRDISGHFRVVNQEWSHVYAHRQSSHTRRGDPGSEIWRRIGSKWQISLGHACGIDSRHTTGKGMPIPLEWSPSGKGGY